MSRFIKLDYAYINIDSIISFWSHAQGVMVKLTDDQTHGYHASLEQLLEKLSDSPSESLLIQAQKEKIEELQKEIQSYKNQDAIKNVNLLCARSEIETQYHVLVRKEDEITLLKAEILALKEQAQKIPEEKKWWKF